MKKYITLLLFPIIFSFCYDKEPPSKFYYRDDDNIHLMAFDNDTAIYIRNEVYDIFDIKTEKKKYQIFYDKKFILLAVEIDVNKKDKSENYKRYSRKGQLMMSFTQVNNKNVGIRSRFYYSGKIKHREYFSDKGDLIGDTTWTEVGIISEINYQYSNGCFKSQNFYSNGKMKSEIFEGSWQSETRFIIDYDSLNSQPNYFLCRDTSITSITDQGDEIRTTHWRKTPIDSVLVIKRKQFTGK